MFHEPMGRFQLKIITLEEIEILNTKWVIKGSEKKMGHFTFI